AACCVLRSFFLSSRRRHTSFSRDWSSDVCSSDLPEAGAATLTMAKAINLGLRAALAADPRVLLMGEDIGTLGGVFRVTDGLQQEFGADRVVDTPLAESGIVGTAIGLAMRGYRPVC